MRIDRTTQKLLCIQIRNSERHQFVDIVNSFIDSLETEVTIDSESQDVLVLRKLDDGILVDLSEPSRVVISMSTEELTHLMEAIEEHIEENSELPLDHALEPLGAKFRPPDWSDVVIETVP
jgi:hypothetical protein